MYNSDIKSFKNIKVNPEIKEEIEGENEINTPKGVDVFSINSQPFSTSPIDNIISGQQKRRNLFVSYTPNDESSPKSLLNMNKYLEEKDNIDNDYLGNDVFSTIENVKTVTNLRPKKEELISPVEVPNSQSDSGETLNHSIQNAVQNFNSPDPNKISQFGTKHKKFVNFNKTILPGSIAQTPKSNNLKQSSDEWKQEQIFDKSNDQQIEKECQTIFNRIKVTFKLNTLQQGLTEFFLFGQFAVIIFSIDIIMTFNTGCYVRGIFTKNRIEIAKHYLRTAFFLDAISVISILLVIQYRQNIYDIPFLVRGLQMKERLTKLNIYFQMKERFPVSYEMSLMIVIILFMAHISGCGFYFSGSYDKFYGKYNWLDHFNMDEKPVFDKYVTSMYFSFISMITVGYGDIHPVSTNEKLYVINMTLFSCGIFGYCINTIGSIFQTLKKKSNSLEQQRQIIKGYLKIRQVSQQTQYKMLKNLEFISSEQFAVDKQLAEDLLKKLDPQLQGEFHEEFYGKIIENIRSFDVFTKKTLKFLGKIAEEKVFQTGEILFSQDTEVQFLYILIQGRIQLFSGNQQWGEIQEKLQMLKDYAVFQNLYIPGAQQCMICQSNSHNCDFCPDLNIKINSYIVTQKFRHQEQQSTNQRKMIQREGFKFNTLQNITTTRYELKKVRINIISMLNAMDFTDEDYPFHEGDDAVFDKPFFTCIPQIQNNFIEEQYYENLLDLNAKSKFLATLEEQNYLQHNEQEQQDIMLQIHQLNLDHCEQNIDLEEGILKLQKQYRKNRRNATTHIATNSQIDSQREIHQEEISISSQESHSIQQKRHQTLISQDNNNIFLPRNSIQYNLGIPSQNQIFQTSNFVQQNDQNKRRTSVSKGNPKQQLQFMRQSINLGLAPNSNIKSNQNNGGISNLQRSQSLMKSVYQMPLKSQANQMLDTPIDNGNLQNFFTNQIEYRSSNNIVRKSSREYSVKIGVGGGVQQSCSRDSGMYMNSRRSEGGQDEIQVNQRNKIELEQMASARTSNYCSLNYTSAERISQLLSQALYEARKDRKLLFWYVLYEIIAESQTKGHTEFIKYLGMHLRQICTHFATQFYIKGEQYPQIRQNQFFYSYIDKYDDMKSIKAIISKWKEDKIFQPVYCESLKMILSNELTKKIYMQLSISGETAIKINQFQSDSRLDNLENMDNDKLASLMEEANQCKSALEAQIINFQDLYQETSGKAFNLLNEYILDHQKQSQDSNAILQENNKIQEE